jgi:hypothetical protein
MSPINVTALTSSMRSIDINSSRLCEAKFLRHVVAQRQLKRIFRSGLLDPASQGQTRREMGTQSLRSIRANEMFADSGAAGKDGSDSSCVVKAAVCRLRFVPCRGCCATAASVGCDQQDFRDEQELGAAQLNRANPSKGGDAKPPVYETQRLMTAGLPVEVARIVGALDLYRFSIGDPPVKSLPVMPCGPVPCARSTSRISHAELHRYEQ